MKIEIAVEGPLPMLRAVRRELVLGFWNARKASHVTLSGADESARLVIEETEESVNSALQKAAQIIEYVEQAFGARDRLSFCVRNAAYAEPPAGGDHPRASFHPVPSVMVQPWYPGLKVKDDSGRIVLDPAHAFGTGKHPTTRMCLAYAQSDVLGIKTPCLKILEELSPDRSRFLITGLET